MDKARPDESHETDAWIQALPLYQPKNFKPHVEMNITCNQIQTQTRESLEKKNRNYTHRGGLYKKRSNCQKHAKFTIVPSKPMHLDGRPPTDQHSAQQQHPSVLSDRREGR